MRRDLRFEVGHREVTLLIKNKERKRIDEDRKNGEKGREMR